MSEFKGKYCIVRTYSAGVFAGFLKKLEGKEGIVEKARRIWSWSGAASLSQLAMEGTKKPESCNFAMPVDLVLLTEVIEVIPCTLNAINNIQAVKEWKV